MNKIEAFLRKIGAFVLLFTLAGIGASHAYMWNRQGDMVDNYVHLKREQSSIMSVLYDIKGEIKESESRVKDAIHDKELACSVLKATISSGKYTHTYCKN